MKVKPLYVILGILVLIVLMGGCSYNGINKARLTTDESWANVQSAYQRRADLIPNLVATVQQAADFEKSTLTEVIEARASATSMNVKAEDLTPETLQTINQQQGRLGQALGRLMVVVERYPDLKTSEQFRELSAEVTGTENRINQSRNDYNAAVRNYNEKVTSFPNNLMAGTFGFKPRPSFEAEKGADKAPSVRDEFKK